MSPREPARSKLLPALLIVLCALAAVLRLRGLDRLLPQLPEPDTFVVLQMQSLRHDPAQIPHEKYYERYPLLIARALALLPIESPAEHIDPQASLDEHLHAAARPYLDVREVSAWMGIALVPLTWLLARRFLGSGGALWAAFFVATSVLHLLYSQQARPHAAHATLALVAVLAALAAHERPTWPRTLAVGAAAGLALACLQSGAFALPPLVAGLWTATEHRSQRARAAVRTLVALVLALAIAAPFYPTLPSIENGSIVLAQQGGHPMEFARFNGLGFARSVRLLWMHDPALVVSCALGGLLALSCAAACWRASDAGARRRFVTVLAYVVPYGLVIGLQAEIYERFLMPLLPYIACASGAAVAWVLASVTRPLRNVALRNTALAIGAACVAAFPAYAALRYSSAAAATDTLEQAAAWIESGWRTDPKNPDPAQSRIATDANLFVPLLYAPTALATDTADLAGALSPWLAYQRLIPRTTDERESYDIRLFPTDLAFELVNEDSGEARRWLEAVRPQYMILELTPKMIAVPMLAYLRAAVLARGELVFQSSGEAPVIQEQGPMNYQDANDFVPRILRTRAFGPGIEIYRLNW